LVDFFPKIKKWCVLVNLSEDFVKKINQLERNFTVSVVIFKKFQPIFCDMFLDPVSEASKTLKSTKKYKLVKKKIDILKQLLKSNVVFWLNFGLWYPLLSVQYVDISTLIVRISGRCPAHASFGDPPITMNYYTFLTVIRLFYRRY
jgi:hypothetical protein